MSKMLILGKIGRPALSTTFFKNSFLYNDVRGLGKSLVLQSGIWALSFGLRTVDFLIFHV